MLISMVQEGGKEKRTFSLEHTHVKKVLWERVVMTGLYFPIRTTRQEVKDYREESNRKSNQWLLGIPNYVISLLKHLFLSALKVTFVAKKGKYIFCRRESGFLIRL